MKISETFDHPIPGEDLERFLQAAHDAGLSLDIDSMVLLENVGENKVIVTVEGQQV